VAATYAEEKRERSNAVLLSLGTALGWIGLTWAALALVRDDAFIIPWLLLTATIGIIGLLLTLRRGTNLQLLAVTLGIGLAGVALIGLWLLMLNMVGD